MELVKNVSQLCRRFQSVAIVAAAIFLCLFAGWKLGGTVSRRKPNVIRAVTGVTISPITVTDLDGTPHVIDFGTTTKLTVLYIIQPGCHWCESNLANIRHLASTCQSSFRFIGLSVVSPFLKSYVASNPTGFPVYQVNSFDDLQNLNIAATPDTLVVTRAGVVIRRWTGAFSGSSQQQIESYFGVKLPGLTTSSTALFQ